MQLRTLFLCEKIQPGLYVWSGVDLSRPFYIVIVCFHWDLCLYEDFPAAVENVAEEKNAELYVECALFIDGAPFGLPTRTRFMLLSLSCRRFNLFEYLGV